MLDYLATQPLLTLVIVLALGLALGKIRIFGISFGAAAVLFVALGLSTVEPDLQLPPLVYQLGLAVFVYAIGLNAGAEFFAQFRHRGWKLTVWVIVLMVAMVALAYAIIRLGKLVPETGAGMFVGSLTSTPGMAAMVNMLESMGSERATFPVVGYSLTYPGAVIGSILVAAIGAKLLKVNHDADATKEGLLADALAWSAVRLGEGVRGTIGELPEITGQDVIASRVVRGDHWHELAEPSMELHPGDVIVLNGTPSALQGATQALGELDPSVSVERTNLTHKRMVVSNKQVAGHTIGELNTHRHGFVIVRLRRGDKDVVPSPDDVLHYSDRVRVVTAPHRLDEVRRFFGDSERKLADVDLFPLCLGLLIGLLIGAIPIPLPGGNQLTLGFGGGPIVAGLVLGALGRTGKVQWQLPYHANRTMSTFGLAIFLAGVGTSAGVGFRSALTDPASLTIIAGGFLITVTSAVLCAAVCMPLLGLRWDEAMGVAAGVTTNPAIISYLNDQTGTELATRGYATVYPTAMIGKILLAQVMLLLVL